MKLTPKRYAEMTKQASPPSPVWKDCTWAFLVGGAICCLGEGIRALWQLVYGQENAAIMTSVTLILLSALLTMPGWYQKLAAKAGAGTLVPITGFANSVVSPAIEFKAEGWITGVGAKLFIIAGPVIAYGTLASWAYGLILWVMSLMK